MKEEQFEAARKKLERIRTNERALKDLTLLLEKGPGNVAVDFFVQQINPALRLPSSEKLRAEIFDILWNHVVYSIKELKREFDAL